MSLGSQDYSNGAGVLQEVAFRRNSLRLSTARTIILSQHFDYMIARTIFNGMDCYPADRGQAVGKPQYPRQAIHCVTFFPGQSSVELLRGGQGAAMIPHDQSGHRQVLLGPAWGQLQAL